MRDTSREVLAILEQVKALPIADRDYLIARIKMGWSEEHSIVSRVRAILERITSADIMTNTRQREVATARFVAYHYLHNIAGYTFQEIGEIFGKHHTSVLHGEQQVEMWQSMRNVYKNENKIYDKLKYLMNNKE